MAILTVRRLDSFIHDERTKAEALRVRYQEKHVDVHRACAKSARQFSELVEGDTATVHKVVCSPRG
jgi:hypothetical protein